MEKLSLLRKIRKQNISLIFVSCTLLFISTTAGCGGGGGDDNDNDSDSDDSSLSVIHLSEAYENYRQVIIAQADGTEDFILQKGLTAREI